MEINRNHEMEINGTYSILKVNWLCLKADLKWWNSQWVWIKSNRKDQIRKTKKKTLKKLNTVSGSVSNAKISNIPVTGIP